MSNINETILYYLMSSIHYLINVRAKGVDGEADLSCHSLESIFILQSQALTQSIMVYVLQAERGIIT